MGTPDLCQTVPIGFSHENHCHGEILRVIPYSVRDETYNEVLDALKAENTMHAFRKPGISLYPAWMAAITMTACDRSDDTTWSEDSLLMPP